ncbi:cupin domain-containing protein [bacterium]|nr:MAG: cupin domain-containing protein [bacterium]
MKQISKQNAPHYQWGNQCDSWILSSNPHLSVKQELMPPQTREQNHLHQFAQQTFYILSGTANMHTENSVFELVKGDSLTIPPKTAHFIENLRDEPLEFLVISQPDTALDRINLS